MSLSWRVQNIVVISRTYLKLERSEFSSNFEFDRNMLSGSGACPRIYRLSFLHFLIPVGDTGTISAKNIEIEKYQRFQYGSLVMGKSFHPNFYNGYNYFSMLAFKSNHGVCPCQPRDLCNTDNAIPIPYTDFRMITINRIDNFKLYD